MAVASTPGISAVGLHWRKWWPLGLLLLGVSSVPWPLVALPAAFFCFIGALALPSAPARARWTSARWLLLVAAAASTIGLLRFILTEAMPGIVGGGRRAVQQHAVSRLREVLFAQDTLRRAGWIDPDGDGVGSAASLSELCGGPPLRGQPERELPVLKCGELVETPLGLAARSGAYLYTVCLPAPGGAWSADSRRGVDEERAERHFRAYAWPEAAMPFDRVFFLDQQENILSAEVPAAGLTCDGAIGAAGSARWLPWRDKKPRPGPLPGDVGR